MKFFDRLALKIFSIIIFVITIGIILILTGIVSLNDVIREFAIFTNGETGIKVILGVSTVLILLALKGLFFTSKPESKGKEGVILENTSGKLVISKESLENLISNVTKEIPGAETVSSRTIVDRNKNLIVYVTAVVSKDVMIKDVSNELQQKVKDAMKRTADLEVKEVNIKIKNITSKKVKGLPSPVDDVAKNTAEEDSNIEKNTEEEKNEENDVGEE